MSTIQLSWAAVLPPGSTYTVWRNGAIVATQLGVTSYSDTTVADNTTYTYMVAAVNAYGPGLTSSPASATTPPAQVTGLTATPVSSSQINLNWTAATGGTSYTVRRGGSVVGTPAGASFSDTGLTANTLYTYTVAANGAGGQGVQSAAVSATTLAASQRVIWNPGVHLIVGDIGGQYGQAATASAVLSTSNKSLMSTAASKNGNKLIKGFCFVLNWTMLMKLSASLPAGQVAWQAGLIDVSPGVSLHTAIAQYIATLPNGPYSISYEINSVGNTINATNGAAGNACSWWVDNTTYGPVTAGAGTTGQHGGVWYGTGSPGGLWLRLDNANVLNDMRFCLVNWQNQCDAAGNHIYSINPFQELSLGGVPPVQAGISNASFIAAMQGTAGIPNGFAKDVRSGITNSLLQVMPTFANGSGSPAGQTATDQIVSIFCNQHWSIAPFDGTNLVNPPDYVSAGQTAASRASWGELSFCGQHTVNGAVVATNWKAAGYDSHHHSVADELGSSYPNYGNPVPPAKIGNGRLPDILSGAQYKNASHFFVWLEFFTGPPCNTPQPMTNAPANYAYPLGGPIVSYTDLYQSLAGFNANSYLSFAYPSAFP